MNIYLLRHGIAAARDDPAAGADSERPLTKKGIKRMRKAAQGIARLVIPFDAILTSPLIRARHTAEIVATELDISSRLNDMPQLSPENSPRQLLSALDKFKEHKHILLVGHEPLLGDFAGFLLSHENDSALEIPLKKGGICCIEIASIAPPQSAQLHWMLTPKQLRMIAG